MIRGSYVPCKMAHQAFVSVTKIENDRDALREARKTVLDTAQRKYERKKELEERERRLGKGDWMLPSVSSRLEKEKEEMHLAKRKKKKEKKKKKKKMKKRSSSSSDSDEVDDAAVWVEKSAGASASPPEAPASAPVVGPQLQRQEWMESPMDLIPTYTRDERRKQKKEAEEDVKKSVIEEQPGQHARELNPYWRDGGAGVPLQEAKPSAQAPKRHTTVATGDGGLAWLLKARRRCDELAAEEGRSVEEVAAERWGSLEKLETKIADARRAQRGGGRGRDPARSSSYGRSRSPIGQEDGSGAKMSAVREQDRDRNCSRDSDRHARESDRNARDSDRNYARDSDRNYSRDSDRYARDSDRNRSRQDRGLKFMKPDDSEATHSRSSLHSREKEVDSSRSSKRDSSSSSSLSSLLGRFARPGDLENDEALPSSRTTHGSKSRDSGSSQRQSSPPGRLERGRGETHRPGASSSQSKTDAWPKWKKAEYRREVEAAAMEPKEEASKKSRNPPGERSESSSSSESSDSSSEDSDRSEEAESAIVPILSEDELNALGAKIVRAELMGDEDRAAQLKEQLSNARAAREKHLAAGGGVAFPERKAEQSRETVAVLTRTSKTGVTYPLPARTSAPEHKGKRRKQGKVETHGKQGERLRYFDDDDSHELKDMVAREKMGTAEDQNAMFARLAGRVASQTNDDFQTDDMFVERAARKQNKAQLEDREQARAMFEHQKVQSSMDRCNFCFNNVPKHLIIAIGTKAYLSLPNHRSLNEGHCLIVPMQHSAAGTALDEDVWQEMQTFRKCLVQMFMAQDMDCVFMETVMGLRRFPHTTLECIPLERSLGDVAPIYFKKAIQESEKEWSDNIKLVDISKKDIRRAIPKGFPYFSVDFGLQGGFAHVIEDEARFPSYFGREIIGGMLDCDIRLWRKPQRENFDEQRKKVLQFEQWWKPYDWTRNIGKP